MREFFGFRGAVGKQQACERVFGLAVTRGPNVLGGILAGLFLSTEVELHVAVPVRYCLGTLF